MPYSDYLGRQETATDRVWPNLAAHMAATLGVPPPVEHLPPLWHWMLFQHWLPPAGLGEDGHPARGGFLPPVDDLPRRMWAGGSIAFIAPLRLGETVTRTSTIASIQERTGGSGRLVFVQVVHDIVGDSGSALREEQTIVYRGTEGTAVKPASAPPPIPDGATVTTLLPDNVLLFRYSALTGNGHRIHYDQGYTTGIENYPGLLVHGPLQATFMAGLVGDRMQRFTFRGRRPAFSDRPLTVISVEAGSKTLFETRDDSGLVCMEGEAIRA